MNFINREDKNLPDGEMRNIERIWSNEAELKILDV